MGHTLNKYLSNRGSALFMVLSTMTALMICCMAMYFSVISSRSTQYAIFNQQQAYQSATSLSDALIAGMMKGENGFKDISDEIWNLDEGASVTTSTNGFKTFSPDGTGKEDDDQVGAYMMTVTRLPDETLPDGTVVRVFDIMVTSSVNGTKEIFHNIIQMTQTVASNPPIGPTNVFTATGYVPNDVYIDGGDIRTDVFFDNEHTIINAYPSTGLSFDGNLFCGGSLTVNGWLQSTAKKPVTFAVRNAYTNHSNNPITFAAVPDSAKTELEKAKARSTVMIGGNYDAAQSGSFANANVYILGDFIVGGNVIDSSSKYFVDGDIILKKGEYGGYWHNLSNVYCNGKVDSSQNTGGGINGALAGKWTGFAQGKDKNGYMTVTEMLNLLNEKTQTGTYYKWIVDYEGVNLSSTAEKTIHFSTDAADPIPTVYLGNASGKKKDGCVIKEVTVKNTNNVGGDMCNLTLVIDTGEDPDNTYTIKLKPNRDFVKTGSDPDAKDSFCFFPRNTLTGKDTYQENSNINFQILTMGRGSVIIDIPDGVIYQEEDRSKFMHYGWFALKGGREHFFGDGSETTRKEKIEHTAFVRAGDSSGDANFFTQFVHRECVEGDGCNYNEKTLTDKCPSCGAQLVTAECDIHGKVDTYCENCTPNRKDHTGVCKNRVDRKAVDNYLKDHDAIKSMMTDSKGELIYPNVNIFLVSCDENANIRISSRVGETPQDDADPFMQNSYFGFIYAPYMTYKAKGDNSGGGMVKLMGGLTVSDYIIDDSYSIISCWPDKFPEDLMHPDSLKNPLKGNTNQSWKIDLKAH